MKDDNKSIKNFITLSNDGKYYVSTTVIAEIVPRYLDDTIQDEYQESKVHKPQIVYPAYKDYSTKRIYVVQNSKYYS